MNLLALETATRRLSVALLTDRGIVEKSEDHPNGGSERVLPWIAQLLAEQDLSPGRLDVVAFGAGPGGFTGLRLACGIAQGLAWGLDIPVVPVGSLDALALAARDAGAGDRVFACLDARMDEVYSAAFEFRQGAPVAVMAAAVSSPGAVPLPPGDGWVGCGDGFSAWPKALADRLAEGIARILPGVLPSAAAVARLALSRVVAGEVLQAAAAAPLYVRDKVALTTAERIARGGVR